MIPIQPQASKRKATDDANPLAATAGKKLKRETSKAGPSTKRKLNGEEQPGGLVIVRAPAPTKNSLHIEPVPAEPRAPSRQPSAQPQSLSQPQPQSSRPAAKKLRADGSSRAVGKAKDRDVYATTRADPEVDEDVRQMQSETDTLRRKSQAAEQAASSLNADVQFPPRTPRLPSSSSRRDVDTVAPLAQQETPQIEKNKVMRGETGHRRRSSISRGKRASSSYEATGVISHPHTSVSVSSFFKHIDYELPEPQRARQLLIWCSNRAMNELADQAPQASTSRRTSTNSGKDPPPLSTAQAGVLKRTQENLMRMLAEKKVDTNVYGGAGSQNGDAQRPLRENEQNIKNRAREARFNAHIQRSKQEAEAWKELSDSYDSHRKSVQAEMEKRRRALATAKSKGKERASAEDLDDWDVERRDLPEQFLSSGSVDVARKLVFENASRSTPLHNRLKELEHTVDRLHTFANSALQTTRVSEADFDRRFALLNLSLASRSQPALSSTHADTTALSSYILPLHPRPPPTDPQDLLRALSRIDADRPQTQVGDAARRAVREVQRVADATAGMAERRLTGVPPPTPRKPPGTPRRATTPGKGR
ncbi:Mis12-Mtw1 protein family-domain-containing protein [Dichomitus squalens]|uniref:Mis12-Mtw1 protein family-domain-containing protein n=1 Tax=Dichomitus squalens TaxID=114155 RepID=A0A4Q9PMJ0_9APHY|nr:Mis12-Mtw1 protein family-domain-containing protein [Dichomitus squalens]